MAKTKLGDCHICLEYGALTFEHVPAQGAFNEHRVQIVSGQRALELPIGETTGGVYQQRGAGGYTLCRPCNNNTGTWYGPAFVEWCVAGWNVLEHTRGRPSCLYVKDVYPLRVIKQIMAMFCSVRGPELVKTHPELRKFLLDRDCVGLPAGLRVFVHFAVGATSRRLGMGAPINLATGSMTMLTELVFPPLGYLMTYDSAPAPDPRLLELTALSCNPYNLRRTMTMNFPLLPTVSPLPADYRTRDEMEHDKAENDLAMEARNASRGVQPHG
jgi:hypothetical protein